MEILKVSSKSNPSKVAGAIANVFRGQGVAEIQTIGAGSLNQAIKAVAIARGFVAPSGKNLVIIPAFSDITIDGAEKTAIKLIISFSSVVCIFSAFGYVENRCYVFLVETSLGCEEFQSVAVERQMACRHHHCSSGFQLLADGGHKHRSKSVV